MMEKLLGTLQRKDTATYYDLFPTFDTLWSMVMHNSDKTPETQKALENLKEHPQALIEFDPLYNRTIIGGFANVLAKGEDSGVNWNAVLMARYELHAAEPTKSLIGYEKVAPQRFEGYMFILDASSRVTFCIRVSEIQKIRNKFFGGQLHNILQAKSVDEFNAKEQQEQDYFAWAATHPDTTANADTAAKSDSTAANDTNGSKNPLLLSTGEDEEDDGKIRKDIVVERRYYEGTLDNEIPISLYIRYMKIIPGRPQQYDGLYKLGENKRYLRLEITKNKEGKWIIEDESAVGTMELVLNGRKYTGAWSNSEDNGYDVSLTQTGAPGSKIELLDKIIDQGLYGKIDEEQFKKEAEEEEKMKLQKEKEEQEEKEKKEKKEQQEKEKKERKERKKKNKKDKDNDNNKEDTKNSEQ